MATENAIWLGIDDPEPKIMAVDAPSLGIKTNETCGWIEYPIPDVVNLSTRMHLTQKQVTKLIPLLMKFSVTGEL